MPLWTVSCRNPRFNSLFSHASAVCEVTLREAGITHTRIDGSMKQQDRTRVVAEFMQDEDCHVLLASTRVAGLGLNLTRATRVIFMCGPSFALEFFQAAFDRVLQGPLVESSC